MNSDRTFKLAWKSVLLLLLGAMQIPLPSILSSLSDGFLAIPKYGSAWAENFLQTRGVQMCLVYLMVDLVVGFIIALVIIPKE